ANNLANSQTTGFKRDFGRILQGEKGYDVGTMVDLSEGDLVNTGNELDAAIDGDGFFAIQTESGVRYTRAGSFTANAKGELVMKDGSKVLSTDGGPIVSTDGPMSIGDSGIVTVNGNDIGTLKIVHFTDLSKLQKEGFYRFD